MHSFNFSYTREGHGSKFLNPTKPNPSAIIGAHNSVMKVRHKSMQIMSIATNKQ